MISPGQIYEQFEKTNQKLFTHIHRCIELGISIPVIKIRWDEKRNELVMELNSTERVTALR